MSSSWIAPARAAALLCMMPAGLSLAQDTCSGGVNLAAARIWMLCINGSCPGGESGCNNDEAWPGAARAVAQWSGPVYGHTWTGSAKAHAGTGVVSASIEETRAPLAIGCMSMRAVAEARGRVYFVNPDDPFGGEFPVGSIILNIRASARAYGAGHAQVNFTASLDGIAVASSFESIFSDRSCSSRTLSSGPAFMPLDDDVSPWAQWNEMAQPQNHEFNQIFEQGCRQLTLSLNVYLANIGQHQNPQSSWQCPGVYTSGVDAGRTVAFSTQGPVFDLPPGWTAHSTDFNIVDNRWLGSTTIPVVMNRLEPWMRLCGESLTLTVEATGAAPLYYQWFRDGQPIDGAYEPALVLTPDQMAGEAEYYCEIWNDQGETASHPVLVSLCGADVNCDGVLNLSDVTQFLNWYTAEDTSADFNGDSILDFFDILAFLNTFARGCP